MVLEMHPLLSDYSVSRETPRAGWHRPNDDARVPQLSTAVLGKFGLETLPCLRSG
jgi:hypothetical protein